MVNSNVEATDGLDVARDWLICVETLPMSRESNIRRL